MKKTLGILFLVFLFITSCNEEFLLETEKDIISVEGRSFELIENENIQLTDGSYHAEIADIPLKVFSYEGIVRWLMPELEEGEYILNIKEADLDVDVIIKDNPKIENSKSLVLDLSEELNLGITEDNISAIPDEPLEKYAKFLFANKDGAFRNENTRTFSKEIPEDLTLTIGETRKLLVSSREMWNPSGIEVKAGEKYEITAFGFWIDLYILTEPLGYNSDFFFVDFLGNFIKRAPDETWFKLMGSVDRERNYPIGASSVVTFQESGNLEFYANDASFMYWNNFGKVFVSIKRIS